jgi:hypothetical protein
MALTAKRLGTLLSLSLALTSLPALAQASQTCATKLSVALRGVSASTQLLADPNPQAQVNAMIETTEFKERFSRFVNSAFNRIPGATSEEDSAYHLAKYLLNNGKPWHELFDGQYKVAKAANSNAIEVTADPEGLGYFRSTAWLRRYAGNELEGYKLSTAYRIQQNIIGLTLVAASAMPGVDFGLNGRQSAACRGCHFDSPFALDKVARVLTRKQGTGDQMTFTPPPAADIPQTVLGGIQISNDKDLVNALVGSDSFRFNTCRLAFRFLYGRPETKVEADIFDQCMSAFAADGKIETAVASIAADPTFCQ